MSALLDLIPGGALVKAAIGVVAGAAIAAGVLLSWNALIENPRLKHEVRIAAEAQLSNRFFKTVGDMTDAAEAARIRARLCAESGRVYDFEAGDCRPR